MRARSDECGHVRKRADKCGRVQTCADACGHVLTRVDACARVRATGLSCSSRAAAVVSWSRGAPAVGRQDLGVSPVVQATHGKLQPRPRAQERLRLGGRVRASQVAVGLAEQSRSSAEQGVRKPSGAERELGGAGRAST